MRRRFMMILSVGLFTLITVLFVLVCHLSRKQHLASVEAIKSDYLEILSQEGANLRERTRTLEREAFALFEEKNLALELCRTNGLFVRSGGRFFPAGMATTPPQGDLAPDEARQALTLGIGLRYSEQMQRAREQLEKAARISVKTEEDLHVRILALVELFKIPECRDAGLVFRIFYALFQYPDWKPRNDRIDEIEATVRKQMPEYDALKMQCAEMWKTAEEVTQIASNRPAPFRMVFHDAILSVNVKEQACLLPVESFRRDASNTILRVSTMAPGEDAVVFRQMRFPPVYAWIPMQEFETRKQVADHAYFLTVAMLVALLGVMIVMGVGIGMIIRRQHEIAALKSSFVSSVSHELRTPMGLIRLYAESLSAEKLQPETRTRYTRAIMAETDRLTALVNNVLDFSRLENGTLTLNVRDADVSKVCGEVLDSFGALLEKEKMVLTKIIAPDLHAMVDPVALTQVIFNLVDNAIKYSGESRRMEVELMPLEDKICLRVKDWGIGIPASLRARVFLPFVRGEDSRVTAQRGTGIGLSITSQLLERMQCAIRFFDNVPQGTVFEVMMKASGDNAG